MPDTPEWILHTASLLASFVGMAWLALGMDVHWAQVCRDKAPAARLRRLRFQGWIALAASLALCLWADHPSMAVLVWPLALSVSGLAVGLLLARRPHWLRILAL